MLRGQDWSRKACDIKPELTQAVSVLQSCESYVTTECTEAFKSLREASNLTHLQAELGEYLSSQCYASLLVPMYSSLKDATDPHASQNLFTMLTAYAQFTAEPAAESSHLCTELQNGDTLIFLTERLSGFKAPLNRLDKNSLKELSLILEILYHCIRFSVELRSMYRKQGLVPLLTSYLDTPEVLIKTTSLVILAYIVDETESDSLATTGTDGCVNFLVFRLKAALHSRVHRAGGFTAAGLLEGMIHLMASDANKVKIMEQGALPLILRMLKTAEKKPFSVEEQILAATAIWKFAFIESNRKALKKDVDVMTALNDHKTSKTAALRDACCGALWEIHEGEIQIEEQDDPTATNISGGSPVSSANSKMGGCDDEVSSDATMIIAPPPRILYSSTIQVAKSHGDVPKKRHSDVAVTVDSNAPHIMISYQWDSQPLMIGVKNALQKAGYNVWMDVEKMEGNILMAMANAVEKAAVVLVAMSHKYKESNNCRTEASYAYKKKKPIVPLLVEDDYDPDGWLGALVGMLLYYKIKDQETLQGQIPAIVKELGNKGKLGPGISLPDTSSTGTTDDTITKSKPTTTEKTPHVNKETSQHTHGKPKTAISAEWTSDAVQKWLDDNDLSQLKEPMKAYDGNCLAKMHQLSVKCPEYYHNTLKTEFGLDLLGVIKLSVAIDELFP